MINKEIVQNFIDQNQSSYKLKYRFHSCYQTGDHTFKIRYYMFDEALRQIDIYIEVSIDDEVRSHFSANLHDQEKTCIVVQFLKRLLVHLDMKTYLHYSLYDKAINTITSEHTILEPLDYIHILNYIKYHRGYNNETMDAFYGMFIPCMEILIEKRSYQKVIESFMLLLHTVVWECEWEGYTKKYLDTEYQYHLYHLRKLIRLIYVHIYEIAEKVDLKQIYYCIQLVVENERLSFAILSVITPIVSKFENFNTDLFDKLLNDYQIVKKGEDNTNANLPISLLYAIHTDDAQMRYEVSVELLRKMVVNRLTYANDDLDVAICEVILSNQGYDIVLELFSRDYNTYIFDCFKIDSFPKEYHQRIKDELIKALTFFAGRMDTPQYRLSSFEQCKNINRLLIDHYKEEIY